MSRVGEAVALAPCDSRTPSMIEAWLRLSEMIGVLFVEQRLEHAAVGVETGGEQDRVVLAEVLRDRLLELAVQRLRAADEAHRGHAEAEVVERALGRRDRPPGWSARPR